MTKARSTTAKVANPSEASQQAPTWENASERERSAIIAAEHRISKRPERLRVRLEKAEAGLKTVAASGGVEASLALRLADAMGTTSQSFSDATLGNIATLIASCNHGDVKAREVNAALAVLDGMKPENEVEAMLLTQMWATNEVAIRALTMIGKADWIEHTATFGNLAVKLLRTYSTQVEALAKLRRKGEQTVKVVHVYPGGQAVVADTISSGGGPSANSDEQSQAASATRDCAALLSQDPQGFSLPVPRGERPEAVPHARRHEPRST